MNHPTHNMGAGQPAPAGAGHMADYGHIPNTPASHMAMPVITDTPPNFQGDILVEDRRGRSVSGRLNALIGDKIDRSSSRTLMLAMTAFLLFFAVLSAVAVGMLRHNEQESLRHSIAEAMGTQSLHTSTVLDTHIGFANRVLNSSATPKDAINALMYSPKVTSAVIVDAQNNILAGSQGSDSLASMSLSGFPQSGVVITSLISGDGFISPVVMQKAGSAFLISALQTGSLTGTAGADFAVVDNNLRVIDGPAALGKSGAAQFFDLPADKLSNMLRNDGLTMDPIDHNGKNPGWLTTVPINGSSLNLISERSRTISSDWIRTALLMTGLFLGTCVAIGILMRNMFKQIKRLDDTKTASEVSQQRYSAAIDGTRGGIWEINLATNEAFLSRSLSGMLGMPQQEHTIPVTQFLSIFHEADREKLLYHSRRAHMSGDFETDLTVARLPLILSVRGRPSTRGSDFARVVVGVALDVTEERGAQARLKAAEARLFDALRSMNDSFVIWDQRDKLAMWNGRFENFFGFAPGTLAKGLDRATVDYNAQSAILETHDSVDGLGREIHLKDGRHIRYFETETSDGGKVSIGTDITGIRTREYQLIENEQALQKTINVLRKSQTRIVELAENYEQEKIRAEQASQSKSEFLANMSHELRTPLNAINGFSDIMHREMFGPLGDPRYKEYVSDILFSGQHLLSLINDILDMSKIEAGKMNLNIEDMRVSDIINQVIRIVRGRADNNRLKLIYDETIETRPIEADPRAVKQVLLNLLTNAIKFTPEGGVVSVSVDVKASGQIISVSDTGIGISKEDIERLAQPFIQIDSQHSKKHEGTGLGLALSKSLVEMHGGNFRMDSVVGEGTTITFTLPNRASTNPKAEADDHEVSDEISKLAKDIAEILDDSHDNLPDVIPVTPTDTPPSVTPAPQTISEPPTQVPAYLIPDQTAPRPVPSHMPAMPQVSPPMPQPVPQAYSQRSAPLPAPVNPFAAE